MGVVTRVRVQAGVPLRAGARQHWDDTGRLQRRRRVAEGGRCRRSPRQLPGRPTTPTGRLLSGAVPAAAAERAFAAAANTATVRVLTARVIRARRRA